MTGTLFGQVNLIGQQGRFAEGDHLLLKEFTSTGLVENVDVYIDLEGSIDRLFTNIKIQEETMFLLKSKYSS